MSKPKSSGSANFPQSKTSGYKKLSYTVVRIWRSQITKYIANISASSIFPILNVNEGGMKKKFQMNALITAARNIGPGLKFKSGKRDTINKNTSETA